MKGQKDSMTNSSIAAESIPPTGPWPQGGLEEVGRCPICASATREILHEGLDDQVFFCAPGKWTLYQCKGCGSGYLDPRPTLDTIGLAYNRYFTHEFNAPEKVEDLSGVRRLRRALANGYRNTRYGTKRRPSSALGVWLLGWLPGQRATLDTEMRHLRPAQPGATLLDVGCGNGAFLDSAIEMGWNAEGVDFDPQAVEVARQRGLNVRHGGIEVLINRSEYYDVITLSHVIEHVHDPLRMLKSCLRLLKPKGRLWLETPNLDSAGHSFYGENLRDLDPPRHLVLFTLASLDLALTQSGFINVASLPPRPLAYQIFSASETIGRCRAASFRESGLISLRWRAWCADTKARHIPASGEFITVLAHKPDSAEISR